MGCPGKEAAGARLLQGGEGLPDAQAFTDPRQENPGLEARAGYALHLANPEKSSFLKLGCISSKILSQREAVSFLYPQPWLRFATVNRNVRLYL